MAAIRLELSACCIDERRDARHETAVIVSRLEPRFNHEVHYPSGHDVCQLAFQPPPHLDPQLPVLLRDEEYNAVVFSLLPYLPCLCDLDPEVLDHLPLKRRDCQDHYLGRVGLVEILQLVFELGL